MLALTSYYRADHDYFVQNLISVVILVALEFFAVISTEELTWKLIKVWIPVNLIFVGMLVTGMYRCILLKCALHSLN